MLKSSVPTVNLLIYAEFGWLFNYAWK
ncbi:hypothetical protein FH968_10925 [Buttiauxella sp. B2]|nr:hypothetical protein FH968_10925 [Buttiauxella sp. B2]